MEAIENRGKALVIQRILSVQAVFLVGLALRLALIPFFGSAYLRDLFIPFLDAAVLTPFENPWKHFSAHYFPYGTTLFGVLYIPRLIAYTLFGKAALGSGLIGLTLAKLPLLVCDILLYRELKKQVGDKNNPIVDYLYWLNPISIYISYIYGQLDIVSMTFCFLCLSYLVRKRYLMSAIWGGLAITSKFQVAAVFPICLAYLWDNLFLKDATKKILVWTGTILLIAVVGFYIPMKAGRADYITVGSPEFFRLFSFRLTLNDTLFVHLGVVSVLLVLARICFSSSLYPQGLLFGAGSVFATILLTTNAMPGWYFWVLPFFALFYARFPLAKKTIYLVMIMAYFGYFVGVERLRTVLDHEQFTFVSSLMYTVLLVSLLINLIMMWVFATRHEAKLEGRSTPFIVGVAGDSGSGKSRLSEALLELFGRQNSIMIEGDDYHKWERHNQQWKTMTHLSPQANFLPNLSRNIRLLRRGSWFLQRKYDHKDGSFTKPALFKARKTIIVQGLHTFYLRGLKELLDLKIFLSPDESVRLAWKMKRDRDERGHSTATILDSFRKRKKDSEMFISPQRTSADWIIEYKFETDVDEGTITSGKLPNIVTSHLLWNDELIWRMIDEVQKTVAIEVEYLPNQPDWIRVIVPETITKEQVQTAADNLFWNLKNTTKGYAPPNWQGGWDGVCQLFTVTLMNKKLFQDSSLQANGEWYGPTSESDLSKLSSDSDMTEKKQSISAALFQWLNA